MNDFNPETAAHLASNLFDLSNVNKITTISKSISKEDPDNIAEFIIILGGIFFTYTKAVEKKLGKKSTKNISHTSLISKYEKS